jgi:thiosulfate reductase cytochrome b subunit
MPDGPLVYRQRLMTRLTHWVWAISLFFLMLTGLQIFNAHPTLNIGLETGFEYDNEIFAIQTRRNGEDLQGITRVFGREYDTTGFLGASGGEARAFPAALTIPSYRSLATGRTVHLFFAWTLSITLLVWLVASAVNGHLRQLIPTGADLRGLPRDIADHARLKFHHSARYNVLQKLAYASVLFIALPLMIATGLSMSPGFNAVAPWLLEVFGGRQTARTIHFLTMVALIGFFVVHILMILAAGPLNEMRSILTGWYRTDKEGE